MSFRNPFVMLLASFHFDHHQLERGRRGWGGRWTNGAAARWGEGGLYSWWSDEGNSNEGNSDDGNDDDVADNGQYGGDYGDGDPDEE